mgnify:CR=1 FL=1
MKKDMRLVQCTVNGKEVAEYVDVRESLLDMLRNRLGLTSVKKGCEVGECGACTVLVDGEAIDSCIYLTMWAEGKHILTVEGLQSPTGELSEIQQAFVDEAAVQCGFCTPGGDHRNRAQIYPGRTPKAHLRASLPLYRL